jgi:hypothetical protein
MPPFNNENSLPCGIWHRIRGRKGSFSSVFNPEAAKSAQTRPRVRFHDKVMVHDIMPRSEFTQPEIRDSWCSKAEFLEFRRDAGVAAYIMARNVQHDLLDDVIHTTRGSHCRLEAVVKRRREHKRQTESAVLGQQKDQRKRGQKDDAAIAAAYSRVSKTAAMDALAMASIDEIDARLYQQMNFSDDDFNDDWISSLSSDSFPSRLIIEDSNFFDESGFDDSWLRDVSASNPLVMV